MARATTSRKSGFILRGGVMRRETLWIGSQGSTVNLASANAAAFLFSLNSAALALTPFTVVRTRGTWFVKSDQTGALEDYSCRLGVAVVSEQAVAIGITAVPTPDLDSGSNLWLLYESIIANFTFVSGVGFHPVGGVMQTFDSKAMRKVPEGTNLVTIAEASNLSNGLDVTANQRVLVKLH